MEISTSTIPETCEHVTENRWFVLRDGWNMERRVCARCFLSNVKVLGEKVEQIVEKDKDENVSFKGK